MFQSAAFATGLPPDLYAFHRYTGNSALLSHPLAWQYPLRFPGWARSFNRRLTIPPTHPVRPVNPNNACHLRITAAAGTKLAVAASGGTVRTIARSILPPERGLQSEDLHPPRGVAASGFRPLRNIHTAASRRSLARVAVPVWLIVLSDQLPVKALVGRYPTNKLIGHELIKERYTHSAAFPLNPKIQRRTRY